MKNIKQIPTSIIESLQNDYSNLKLNSTQSSFLLKFSMSNCTVEIKASFHHLDAPWEIVGWVNKNGPITRLSEIASSDLMRINPIQLANESSLKQKGYEIAQLILNFVRN